MNSSDELLLQHCCNIAWQAQTLALPNPSVGALITDSSGRILGRGVHMLSGSAHAEVLAIKEAYLTLSHDKKISHLTQSAALHEYILNNHCGLFKDCTLYVSLEPCNHQGKTPPCAALIAALGFKRVCIAASENYEHALGGAQNLIAQGIEVQFFSLQSAYDLLLPFEILYKKKKFVLFKLAMRLDGSYTGGRISCDASRIFTHNQRSVCDMICVSGSTWRSDKPKLNARYTTPPYRPHTPKIGVISRQENILLQSESTAFLIRCAEDFANIAEGFVIVEGGFNLLESLLPHIDMFLVHQAFSVAAGGCIAHNLHTNFALLHSMNLGEDIALWLR